MNIASHHGLVSSKGGFVEQSVLNVNHCYNVSVPGIVLKKAVERRDMAQIEEETYGFDYLFMIKIVYKVHNADICSSSYIILVAFFTRSARSTITTKFSWNISFSVELLPFDLHSLKRDDKLNSGSRERGSRSK